MDLINVPSPRFLHRWLRCKEEADVSQYTSEFSEFKE